jgi:hypothetical protein
VADHPVRLGNGADDAAGGVSSRPPATWGKVWPPHHRRDRQRRPFVRTDPAGRGEPTCVHENVGRATAIGDLEADVFIEGRALKRFPAVTFETRSHAPSPDPARPLRLLEKLLAILSSGRQARTSSDRTPFWRMLARSIGSILYLNRYVHRVTTQLLAIGRVICNSAPT